MNTPRGTIRRLLEYKPIIVPPSLSLLLSSFYPFPLFLVASSLCFRRFVRFLSLPPSRFFFFSVAPCFFFPVGFSSVIATLLSLSSPSKIPEGVDRSRGGPEFEGLGCVSVRFLPDLYRHWSWERFRFDFGIPRIATENLYVQSIKCYLKVSLNFSKFWVNNWTHWLNFFGTTLDFETKQNFRAILLYNEYKCSTNVSLITVLQELSTRPIKISDRQRHGKQYYFLQDSILRNNYEN